MQTQGKDNHSINSTVLSCCEIPTPAGYMTAYATDAGLAVLCFGRLNQIPPWHVRKYFPRHQISNEENNILLATRAWISNYFLKKTEPHSEGYDVNKPLSSSLNLEFKFEFELRGSNFELKTWQALLAIPFGLTRTYSQLATMVGVPGAARAVGRAVGKNPIAIIIPCHRIIGANGSLTGYAGGLRNKEILLRHENNYAGTMG